MLTTELFEHLCRLAEALGYTVRAEPLPVTGGVCQINGKPHIFINAVLALDDQIDQLATALNTDPALAQAAMHPEVRAIFQRRD